MAQLLFKDVNKVYPNGYHAVHDFNMEIKDGEFICLVGDSGCGKSTTLRMIAGLEDITSGEFYIDGKLANQMSSRDRGIAMVFQSYALYPHLTVYENLAFGLTLEGIDADIIEEKVQATAKILGLTDYLERFPRALSGGQCQRVAVGRALIRKVNIFLMDEPLSNLDAKQRAPAIPPITPPTAPITVLLGLTLGASFLGIQRLKSMPMKKAPVSVNVTARNSVIIAATEFSAIWLTALKTQLSTPQ